MKQIRSNQFQYLSLILVIVSYVVLLVVVQLSFRITDRKTVNSFLALAIGILFPTLIYFLNLKYFSLINLTPPAKLKIERSIFIELLIGGLIALIIHNVVGFIFYLKTNDISNITFNITLDDVLIYTFLAATAEEAIFRGTLLNFFIQKKRKYLGLFISGSIFGLLHLFNYFTGTEVSFTMILNVVLGGFLLGLVYVNFGLITSLLYYYVCIHQLYFY